MGVLPAATTIAAFIFLLPFVWLLGAPVSDGSAAGRHTCPNECREALSPNLMGHRDRVLQPVPVGIGLHGAVGAEEELTRGVVHYLPDFSFNLRRRSRSDDAVAIEAAHKGPLKQLR